MKKIFLKTLSVLLCVLTAALCLCSCGKTQSTPVDPADFRVTAYIVCGDDFTSDGFDSSNLSTVTDIIVFGLANFDENGQLTLNANLSNSLEIIRSAAGGQNIYLNILGPSSQSDSDDWNEQMHDLADRHTSAFESGILEQQIKDALDEYQFDGVVFDYEFPLRSKDWDAYDSFILSLRETLGDDYKIGMSMVDWNLKQSKQAREATDFFELMSYDLWDDDGNHATMEIARENVEKMVKKGYDKADIDLGLPFYARPTTQESYWYDYKSYYDKIDENGLYNDDETGLTFSFNTYSLIKEKTAYALDEGLGGVMVWHYACDLPADNEQSLFNAIAQAKSEAQQGVR